MGVTRGGGRGVPSPPLESEFSFICIGFSPINDVRAWGWPPPGKGAPPLENFLVTPMPVLDLIALYIILWQLNLIEVINHF